jgi:hypothetical protein
LTTADYYNVLDLQRGSTLDEIKKAYRKKAREYHPDINHTPEAKDMFILVTEAYEFLVTNSERVKRDSEAYDRAMDDWRKYRQSTARSRARVYSRTTYVKFKNTNFYKSTRIFDGTTIIFSLLVSIMVLIFSVTGYFYRLHHPIPGVEPPTISILVVFILLGMVLFVISVIFLKAYLETSQKNKRRKNERDR